MLSREETNILLVVSSIIIIIGIMIWRIFYKPIITNPISYDIEDFQDFKKAKEQDPVCVKPFAIVNDKDKVFDALKILNQKVDEMEFDMQKQNKQTQEVYKWYKLKVDKDSKEAKAIVDEGNAKLKKQFEDIEKKNNDAFLEANKDKLDKQLKEAQKKDGATINDILGSTGEKADADDKKNMDAEIKNAGAPSGFF